MLNISEGLTLQGLQELKTSGRKKCFLRLKTGQAERRFIIDVGDGK